MRIGVAPEPWIHHPVSALLLSGDSKGDAMLSKKLLQECFIYDESTGLLTWKSRPSSHFKSERYRKAFNKRMSGKIAGSIDIQTGYIKLSISDKTYYAHRIIMELSGFGTKDFQIDHINGNKSDNRLCNLRVVDGEGNAKNQKRAINNSSGYVGVTWSKDMLKWRAAISINKKLTHIGYYDSIEDAVAARKGMELKNGYHSNHGRN